MDPGLNNNNSRGVAEAADTDTVNVNCMRADSKNDGDGDVNLPPELDRTFPPLETLHGDAQLLISSGVHSPQRSHHSYTNGIVMPPTFVHVPTRHHNIHVRNNNYAEGMITQDESAFQLRERAQTAAYSVSDDMRRNTSALDLMSYNMHTTSHTHDHHDNERIRGDFESYTIFHPHHLFMNETRLDKKEQFEERLRRAHLRIQTSNAAVAAGSHLDPDTACTTNAAGNATESSEKRYRSKSTPSRGVGGGMPRRSFNECQIIESGRFGVSYNNTGSSTSNTVMQKFGEISCHGESNRENAHHLMNLQQQCFNHPNEDEDIKISSNIGANNEVLNFSSKSYVGSDHDIDEVDGGQRSILEPPPPPPPATEKERLVERERQARLESERARRRHLALQRERHREGDDDEEEVESGDIITNGSNNGALLGQVSFDAGLELHAPEFVGDNDLVLGMHNGSRSSVGSSISIPIPPLPPPPTERERLVERERQARLETERARRRRALLRERHQEDIDNEVENVWADTVGEDFAGPRFIPLRIHEPNGVTTQLRTPGEIRLHSLDSILPTDVEANNLSFPMERFLEKANNDGGSIIVPSDLPDVENDTTLPYTMELFLAEHAIQGPRDDSGVSDTNAGGTERSGVPPLDQQSQIYDDENDEDIHMNIIGEHMSTAQSSRSASDRHSEDSWISHASSSTSSSVHARSHDLLDADSIPRLTEADIAQFSEVEHASVGNAAPQSVRDEPSEPSVLGRGAYLDHAFSVATQTTVIESVTETSVCPLENAFSDINESGESVHVIRLGSVVSVSTNESDGASSASVEAMPSRASSDSGHSHSVGMSDELSRSEAPVSHSSFDGIGNCRLTEAVIVTQAEIDCASIGNTPPHSIRDDHLSDSSITERVGRQSINISTRIGEHILVGDLRMSVDAGERITLSNQTDTASVEAMPSVHSGHSIEVTPSELHDGIRDMHEETINHQPSDLDSITSIEALPSIDLEIERGIFDYGAMPSGEFRTTIGEDNNGDIETVPLLSGRSNGQPRTELIPFIVNRGDSSSQTENKSVLVILSPSLILIIAELPSFIAIAWGNDQVFSLIGMKKFQIVLASLVMTSILNHAGELSDIPCSIC